LRGSRGEKGRWLHFGLRRKRDGSIQRDDSICGLSMYSTIALVLILFSGGRIIDILCDCNIHQTYNLETSCKTHDDLYSHQRWNHTVGPYIVCSKRGPKKCEDKTRRQKKYTKQRKTYKKPSHKQFSGDSVSIWA
jgi:hypothetical protein